MKMVWQYANGLREIRDVARAPLPVAMFFRTKGGAVFHFVLDGASSEGYPYYIETDEETCGKVWRGDDTGIEGGVVMPDEFGM